MLTKLLLEGCMLYLELFVMIGKEDLDEIL